nr:helical backbone metal receptor [Accumulibacter sp.]
MQWPDALGKRHERYPGRPRIVSLVPSLTELLCAIGLADSVVGRTGFCVHPRPLVRHLPKVGGTKGFSLARLRALQPTHVVVNVDENRREEVAALYDFVPHVIVTHPLAPRDNLDLYRLLGGVFGREREADELCRAFEREWVATAVWAASVPRQKVLYLIWRQPWMSVARDTYISRVLAAVGWDTLPFVSLVRYPEIDLPALSREVDVVLLSSEPYPFRDKHLRELRQRQAAGELAAVRVALIDGEMVSWYGTRAIAGLPYLRRLRAELANSAAT